jgi:hypothetical protein
MDAHQAETVAIIPRRISITRAASTIRGIIGNSISIDNVATANSPDVSSFLSNGKTVRADASRCSPVFQIDDGRGLSKVLSNIAETRANQSYGRSEFMRFDLQILRPMMDLKIARRIDHD